MIHRFATRFLICCVIAAVTTVLAGCGNVKTFPREDVFRFRWTVKVLIDGKMHVGSSVVEAIQREGQCMMPPQGRFCMPKFNRRGVSPIIRLPNDAMIVPVFTGYYVAAISKDSDKIDWRGADVSSWPWFLYVPTPWGLSKTQKMVRLPTETPPLEIPFEGHPLSKLKPSIVWVPGKQGLGPPEAHYIGPKTAKKITGLDIRLVSFGIAKTNEPLIEYLPDMPPWAIGARGQAPRISSEERQRRIDRTRDSNDHWTSLFSSGFETGKQKR